MNLFGIIITIQMCHTFYIDENPQLIQNIIQLTFGYNCEERPKVGDILFWKISNIQDINNSTYLWADFRNMQFELQEYIQGITKFQSNGTYMIFLKAGHYHSTVYYWLGSWALLVDKKAAAKYTIQHYLLLKKYYKLTNCDDFFYLHRERETIESDFFQYKINALKRNIGYRIYQNYLEDGRLPMYPNLYIVRGKHTTRIKKVPTSTLWLKNDTCMVLETGHSVNGWLPVYIRCGPEASEKALIRARRIADILNNTEYVAYRDTLQTINSNYRLQLKSFIELLEDKNYRRPNEVDNSNDHLKDAESFIDEIDARTVFSKISSGYLSTADDSSSVLLVGGLLKKDIVERPINSLFQGEMQQASHILDTDSISGVLLQVESSLDAGLVALLYAEEYVHNKEVNTSKAVPLHIMGKMFPNYLFKTFDFNINFIKYPPSSIDW